MDQHSGSNASQSENTNHSSTVTNPLLSLGVGQQASILQVGGQSFLILTTGQSASPLQGLGLNLVPVSGPEASLLQTSEPQPLQVGVLQPAIGQIGESKPLPSQTGRLPPDVVQNRGPGIQPQAVQANELLLKPSQSSTVKVRALQSSLGQGGYTIPPHSATLLTHGSKMKSKPGVEDSVQSVVSQAGGAMPKGSQQIGQVGGLVIPSIQFPLEMAKTILFPTSQIKIPLVTEKTSHQAVVQNREEISPLNQTGRFQRNIVQFDGLPSSSAQEISAVAKLVEFCQANAKINTEPADSKPLTIEASGQYAKTANLFDFRAPTVQSSLFQPTLMHTVGVHSLENAKKYKQSLTKKGSKCQQDAPKYVDVGCSAHNLVRMKNACTNTFKRNKSIGTQVKMSLRNKNQAVQFPESSYGEPDVPIYQECSTQSEEFFWPGQVGFRQSSESHPHKVVIVRDPKPENVSMYVSESSHGDSDRTCNMEGVEKWLHGSCETEHPHFDDVAVYFTEEEWARLNHKEKKLYKMVMMDNYWNFVAVGKISVTPPVISKIEKGEEPCMRSLQQAEHKLFPDPDSKDNPSSQNTFSERYNIQGFYERLKVITTPIKLAMAGLPVTRITSDPSFCEPSGAAKGKDKIRDPGEQCPYKPYFKEEPVINERPFRCFKCERTFKHFSNLSSHYQRAHQSKNDLTCSECGKKFTKMKALLLHYMRHTGDRPFVCTGCGRTFTSQVFLNKHYGLNSKKNQYECLECGKQFGLKHSLIKHEKLHQMEDQNVCHICGKQFSHKSGLCLHKKTHDFHYVCSHCGRYFSSKEDCEMHIMDHRQVPLFICAECNSAFIYEIQLIEHQKLHKTDYTSLAYPDLLIKVKEED